MKKYIFIMLCMLFLLPVKTDAAFCYKGNDLSGSLEPIFLGGTDLYHHTSQGMCVAGKYIVYTRFNTDSDYTTYVLVDIEKKQEVAHYDFHTLHSNSLAYNPETKQIVAVSRGHAFVFSLKDEEMIFEEDIILPYNCPKIAYVEKAFYLGTGSAVYRSEDLHTLTKQFEVEHAAIDQGMGSDGKSIFIIWYKDTQNYLYEYDLTGKLKRKLTLFSKTFREVEDVDFYKDQMVINIANSGAQNGVYFINSTHDYLKWVVDKKETCAKEGERHRTCLLCEKTEKEIIPATGKHQAGEWEITKEPTCEEIGEHIKKCIVCKKVMKKEGLDALGHDFSKWETVKEATVLEEGEEQRICGRCKKQESNTLPKLPATIRLNVKEIPLQKKHSTDCVKVTLGKGDYIKTWYSDNPEIASVDQAGHIEANKRGETTMTVRSEGGAVSSFKVKVTWLPVATKALKVSRREVSLGRGEQHQLYVQKEPLTSTSKIRYKSKDKKIATVDKDGMVYGVGIGKTTIVVSSWFEKEEITVEVY